MDSVMRMTILKAGLVALSLVCSGWANAQKPVAPPTKVTHPLDALTAAEINRTMALLKKAGNISDKTRFAVIRLLDPAKAEVLAWLPGMSMTRRALVVALDNQVTIEGLVDLTAGQVVSWKPMPNRQASFLFEEVLGSTEIVKADAGWRAAMAKRGVTKFDNIACNPLAVGNVADATERSKRLMKVPCFDITGAKDNVYARPFEGLIALVDLSERKVLRLIDLGVVPTPTDAPRFDLAAQKSARMRLNPLVTTQPQGSNIKFKGSEVSWDRWRFHLRLDRRVGPALSLIRYQDGSRERSVAYRVSPSEMFVPYMDSDETWSFKSYLDAGEYGLGLLASPLTAGIDCPVTAKFLNAVIQDDTGKPAIQERAVCVFERNSGDPLWRHFEYLTGGVHSGRGQIDLVVRSIATIGNYDYIIDYVFNAKGEIDVRVGATGIDAVKGVASQSLDSPSIAADTKPGTLIAPGLVGVNHDHYISFRLDMDVDGPANSFVTKNLVPMRLPETSVRRSLWTVDAQVMQTEGPATGDVHKAFFAVVNPGIKGPLGHQTGYVLLPGHSATSMLSPDDPLQGRAAFSAEMLWVTAYNADELYAAGTYANQSAPGEGLPVYVADRQSVVNTDIVLWYTMGFRHVTRTEDWPVMPTLWHNFTLRPNNFFTRNPGMDSGIAPAR